MENIQRVFLKTILLPLNYPIIVSRSRTQHKSCFSDTAHGTKNRHHQSATRNKAARQERASERAEAGSSVESQEWAASENILFIILLGYKSELMNRIIKNENDD